MYIFNIYVPLPVYMYDSYKHQSTESQFEEEIGIYFFPQSTTSSTSTPSRPVPVPSRRALQYTIPNTV